MKPSNFNEEEKVWIWSYGNNNYFYDKGEKCRMKVLNVKFKSKVEISKIIKNDNENIENEIEKMHITLEKLRQTKRDLENENENLDFKINNLKRIIKRIQDENDGI
jgi:predicted RNase H-like nuclease (RuvC/YqgF family)